MNNGIQKACLQRDCKEFSCIQVLTVNSFIHKIDKRVAPLIEDIHVGMLLPYSGNLQWEKAFSNFAVSEQLAKALRLGVSVHPHIREFFCKAVNIIMSQGSHTVWSNHCMTLSLAKLSCSTSSAAFFDRMIMELHTLRLASTVDSWWTNSVSVFHSGTIGTAYLLVCSDSKTLSRAVRRVFAKRTHCSKVIDDNKTLGWSSNALVHNVCIDQNLG